MSFSWPHQLQRLLLLRLLTNPLLEKVTRGARAKRRGAGKVKARVRARVNGRESGVVGQSPDPHSSIRVVLLQPQPNLLLLRQASQPLRRVLLGPRSIQETTRSSARSIMPSTTALASANGAMLARSSSQMGLHAWRTIVPQTILDGMRLSGLNTKALLLRSCGQ